jgi:similar to stage IV sporulation protein
MHVRIDHLLLGYCEFLVKAEQGAAFLNVCHALSCPYEWLGTRENAFCVRCLTHRYAALVRACEAAGVVLTPMRRAGLPAFLCRYRRRVGILVGGIVAAMVFYLASNVVWDVRVEGEGGVNAVQLKRELSLCGLSVGTFIPSLDTDEVESRLVTTSGDVAWVSVNRKGTVAYVQVRPLLKPEAVDSAGATVNLVASQDGVVESVRLMAGDVAIRPGDVVRKGQLLIAGVRDIREDGFVLTEARGEVLARTTHTLTVEIPLVYEQKTYTGAPKAEKTLFFFGKAIKVTKSTGIVTGNCDTIKKMEIWSLPGGVALPIHTEATVARIYERQIVAWSDEQLYEQAYEQLERELSAHTAGGMLLSQRVSSEITDEGILLSCRYQCVENIAKTLPIDTGAP